MLTSLLSFLNPCFPSCVRLCLVDVVLFDILSCSDCSTLVAMKAVSAIGFDLVRGEKTLELIQSFGFPSNKYLFAGVVDGRNIWANDLAASLQTLEAFESIVGKGLHLPCISQCLMLIFCNYRRDD